MELTDFLAPREANFRPLTPVDFLRRSIDVYPDKAAVIFGDETLTYREFGELVGRIAAALAHKGVGRGDVVSAMMANRPEMLAMHYAVPMLGAVLNSINTRLDIATIGYILQHSESRLVIADASLLGAVVPAARVAGIEVIAVGGDAAAGSMPLDAFLSGVTPMDVSSAAIVDEWMPICLNYTSGTTGKPKGVAYTHRGAFLNAIGNVVSLGFTDRTRYLWILPMFHCNGWSHTWAVTAAGGTHVCLSQVDPAEIFREIGTRSLTHFCCAPVVLYMLLNAPVDMRRSAPSPIRVATGGAAPTTALIAGLDELGIELVHLYGLTESYGPATGSFLREDWGQPNPAERAALLARQGVRHPLCQDADVVDETGRQVPNDSETVGEIVLRSNTLMAGYYRDEEATEKAFAGGMFHSGDLAVRHRDGYIEIKDRAKDIIISGGENISSLEVENVLHQHPAVLLAAVVSVPDPKWGEVPCACIELKAGQEPPTPEQLTAFCRERLAGFKVPRKFVFRELPKTATGKIQKFMLRHELDGGKQEEKGV